MFDLSFNIKCDEKMVSTESTIWFLWISHPKL